MSYSRKQITKAGNILITSKSEEERDEALKVINIWRTNHLLPLFNLKNSLVRKLEKYSITPFLISQRLKRLSSIEYKLDLNENMGLGGMQDIGGFRAVLKDTKDLLLLKYILLNAKSIHKIEKINDYVENPKESGYRSIHFIYKYSSKFEKYNGLRIELQIRTKLQHNWATAVETVGIITNTSLKSSQGPDEWLEFFEIISSLFAIKENLPKCQKYENVQMEELMRKCYEYCKRLNVVNTLKALRISTKKIESDNFPGDYYLINIDFVKMFVKIMIFKNNDFQKATNTYLEHEKSIKPGENAVVLVSASSLKSLKRAYPSYFLDTSEFIHAIETINNNCLLHGFLNENEK